jgi:Fanconi anemia group M protein
VAASTDEETVVHPLIPLGAVARRDYQIAIAHEAAKRNTLVILPTGMGKTVVALLVIADRLQKKPGKVLLLAPTKPLVEQHARFFSESLLDAKVESFTGETSPEERDYLWHTATVVCSTPQVIQNDVVAGRYSLADVTFLLFDEAHRATGDYPYVFLAESYRRDRPDGLVMAMTASPGAKAEKVAKICEDLGIEGVEVRTEYDADTAPYVQDTDVEWKEVQVPERLKQVAALLREMQDEKIGLVRAAGAIPSHLRFTGKKVLLDAGRILQARIQQGEGEGNPLLFKALSAQAAALKVGHALELAETQGVQALLSYVEKLTNDQSKAAKSLVEDARMKRAIDLLAESRTEHPKLRQVAILLRQQLKEKPDARIIVFTNYRDTSETLVHALAQQEGIRPARFVGQASRGETDAGMSQKKQVETIEQFKAGVHNVLVATSVAEEGLDIPQVDLVVFFEPVPSEIRAIQRRGRTGRRRAGRVVILITKETRDELSQKLSGIREGKMRKEVQALKAFFKNVNASESSDEWRTAYTQGRPAIEKPLTAFMPAAPPPSEPRVAVVADHREFSSAVVRELSRLGVVVKPETLETADYVLSERVAVERKAADDFASSLIDGRLFTQVKALRDAYTAPLLVVEGEGLLTGRKIAEDAIYGAIASITTDFHVSVLFTKDEAETAKLLAAIARREQQGEKKPLAVRAGGRSGMSDDERLRFLVEGLPHVSAVLARRLLEKFGTVREIVEATPEELASVEGIGRATAESIHRILRTQYVGKPWKE